MTMKDDPGISPLCLTRSVYVRFMTSQSITHCIMRLDNCDTSTVNVILTHLPLDKMDAILTDNAFS